MNAKWSPVFVLMENAEIPLVVLSVDVTVDLPWILKRGIAQVYCMDVSLRTLICKGKTGLLSKYCECVLCYRY